jgi:hypothetical protein
MIRDLPAPGVDQVPHHVGFAVADLAEAMERVGALLGLRWQTPVNSPGACFRSGGRRVEWQLSHVKSTGDNGLMVELLQGGPGSTWFVPAGIAFHHWAYAPDDRAAMQDVFEADGWTVDLCRDVDDLADSTFAYFAKAGSARVELCNP